jgi:hypothetical protein
MFEQGKEISEPFKLMNEQNETESAIEMLSELLPDLKGAQKKECKEAIDMLKELLPASEPATKVEPKSEPKEKWSISYLNKKNNFRETKKEFNSYEDAVKWGKKNLGNFNHDMVRMEMCCGGKMNEGGGVEEEDLFEHYDKLPKNVKTILDKYSKIEAEEGFDYEILKRFEQELKPLGYTFEYGLDAEPYDLKKIKMSGGGYVPTADNVKNYLTKEYKVDDGNAVMHKKSIIITDIAEKFKLPKEDAESLFLGWAYGVYGEEIVEKMSGGGSVPSKITGIYNVKGKGLNADIKIYGAEKNTQDTHSLYQASSEEERNNEIVGVNVKTSALARLSKGKTVAGITAKGVNVKITRVKDLFMAGGKVGDNKALIKKINNEIKKHKANPDYDEGGENMNKVFAQFEKQCFVIDDDEAAFDYILGATPIETLEYLKKRAKK